MTQTASCEVKRRFWGFFEFSEKLRLGAFVHEHCHLGFMLPELFVHLCMCMDAFEKWQMTL